LQPFCFGQRWWENEKQTSVPELSGMQNVAGILAARGLYAEKGYYETFDILSAELANLDAINAPRIQDGSLSDFSGYKITLPDRFASKYGTQVGDTVSLKIDGKYHGSSSPQKVL